MAVVNRTLDATEQRKIMSVAVSGTSGIPIITGTTLLIGVVPWPCTLDAGQLACFGQSGAPTVALAVQRFIPGTGATSYVIATGTSNLPPAFGTSGVGISAMILPAAGSTLLNLLANDVLHLVVAGGAGAACTGIVGSLVLKPIQDIKTNFGLTV